MTREDLGQVLRAELGRWREVIRSHPERLGSALHTLKGGAAMAGETELALVLTQLLARHRAGDPGAGEETLALLGDAQERLGLGLGPLSERWPVPPRQLRASAVDARWQEEWERTAEQRLGELAALLGRDALDAGAVDEALRIVHALKGAAGASGDTVTAWYCHGLEGRLRAAVTTDRLRDMEAELARHLNLLRGLVRDPEEGLTRLRIVSGIEPVRSVRREPAPSAPARNLRLEAGALGQVLEQVERLDGVSEQLRQGAARELELARELAELRGALREALRLIGPARPWGAPAAALRRIEEAAQRLGDGSLAWLERADSLRRTGLSLERRLAAIREELSAAHRTTVGDLFDRLEALARQGAGELGCAVRVERSGGDVWADRRTLERLFEPLAQLVRNAVVHGFEPARTEALAGTLRLKAEVVGDYLRLSVEDDGRGIDLDWLRATAVERSFLSRERASRASELELIPLLFQPGVTRRSHADLHSGRGLGLDVALEAVHRLGGSLRLGTRRGGGVVATLEVPRERSLIEVLWVESGGRWLALPVSFTGRIRGTGVERRTVALSDCLGLPATPARASVELRVQGAQEIAVAVQAVGQVETVTLRPLPRLAGRGPFAGAILRPDGELRLALDAAVVAARAWARAA